MFSIQRTWPYNLTYVQDKIGGNLHEVGKIKKGGGGQKGRWEKWNLILKINVRQMAS